MESSKIVNNNDSKLYKLSDITPFRQWDYSLPTFTQPQRFTERRNYIDETPMINALKKHNLGFSWKLFEAIGLLDKESDLVYTCIHT